MLFILDASASMWEKLQGKTKIAIAKEKMTELIRALPPSTRIVLEVSGHRQKGNCEDIEILVPLGQVIRTHSSDASMQSQQKVKHLLHGRSNGAEAPYATVEEATTVVLISDGKETCGGDPCAMVRDLRAKGVKVTVHVVGFNVPRMRARSCSALPRRAEGSILR